MAPTLYYAEVSPAVRGTLILIKALGLKVDLVPVNLMAGEHMTPEFLKMNPQHTVPTLKDGDFAVWDSHAINIYLLEKYAPNSDLYPSDPQKRAVVHQRLFFDTGVVFPKMAAIVASFLREGAKSVSKDKADQVSEAYNLLESFLERSTYVAGEALTVADFSLFPTVTSCNVLVPLAANRYPKITAWIDTLQKLPYCQEGNKTGNQQFEGMIRSKMA